MAKAKVKAPVATQFKRPGGGQTKQQQQKKKRKTRRTAEIVRPWAAPQFEELPKEERDIVLGRLQKEVADVPATRSHAVQGVNQVARAVARGEVGVVVFANNPESLAFGHLPLLCRLHQVPICVLHLSSRRLGRLFQLKSLVAVGIRVPKTAGEGPGGQTDADAAKQLTEAEQKKVVSITEFLTAKASTRV